MKESKLRNELSIVSENNINKAVPIVIDHANHEKIKLFLALVCSGFVIFSGSLLVGILVELFRTKDVCYDITEVEENANIKTVSDPVLVNYCIMKQCDFDVSMCAILCPIGYMLDDSGCPKSCICGKTGYIQGDIAFSSKDIPSILKMISDSIDSINSFSLEGLGNYNRITTWGFGENSVVPIGVDSSLDIKMKKNLKMVMFQISMKTCIRFKPYENEADYLQFQRSSICSSRVGRRPGKNILSVNKHCIGVAGLLHLIMHTLGLHHEQAQPRRDNYVTVHWNNIDQHSKLHFGKFAKDNWLNLNVSYDPMSLLHFPAMAFATYAGKKTITSKSKKKVRGENIADLYAGMQDEDFYKLNVLYRCPGYEAEYKSSYWSSWSEWKYSELKHECVSRRTCFKVDHDVTVDALCLGDDGASVRYEVKTAPYCDEAIHIEVEKVGKGSKIAKQGFAGAAKFARIFRGLCKNGKVVVGQFTADSFSDVICHIGDGYLRLFIGVGETPFFYNIDWEGPTPLCKYESDPMIFAQDLNGDGVDDLLCQRQSKIIEVILAKNSIFENALDWSGMVEECRVLIDVVDLNSDGKADIICADTNTDSTIKIFSNLL